MFISMLVSLDEIRVDVIRYEPHALPLNPLKLFFQQLHYFLQRRSCFIKGCEKEGSIKLRPLRLHNDGCFETLNLPHVSCCEIFTFCDVLHETKQKTQTNSPECAAGTGNHLLVSKEETFRMFVVLQST